VTQWSVIKRFGFACRMEAQAVRSCFDIGNTCPRRWGRPRPRGGPAYTLISADLEPIRRLDASQNAIVRKEVGQELCAPSV
jgi:hypothetical protein